jgi:hypothetical protein
MEHKAPESERAVYLNLKRGAICRKKRLPWVLTPFWTLGKRMNLQ